MLHDYVITRRGTDYVLYEGLLAEAHRQGLSGIRTRLLQAPGAVNGYVALCAAAVTTPRGEFAALGEASPATAGRAPGRTLIQAAETLAKARALRDALNADVVPFEELDPAALREDQSGEEPGLTGA
jgi:hypothetical protein